MSGNYRGSIYSESSDKLRKIEKVLEVIEKGVDNLTERDIQVLERLLGQALAELPNVTRTGIEKKKLYDVLKILIEDLKQSETKR